MNEDFYIGWDPTPAAPVKRRMKRIALLILLVATVVPILLATSQRLIGDSFFEWGHLRSFSGILQLDPYPSLLVSRPGKVTPSSAFSRYHLVAPWKFGLNPQSLAPLDGKTVSLKGTLIYRDSETMIETKPEWIEELAKPSPEISVPQPIQLGRQTLVGEIVDSKCFLGVMNPGQLSPHRACAVRCISGGVPPVLLVRQRAGPPIYLLLVSSKGTPVNDRILDLVAEPVEITGEVERRGETLILRADPEHYRRQH